MIKIILLLFVFMAYAQNPISTTQRAIISTTWGKEYMKNIVRVVANNEAGELLIDASPILGPLITQQIRISIKQNEFIYNARKKEVKAQYTFKF
ncbi:MAG: hypothetical protein N4A33_01750 [Bacteriovoracaceae bacterium]|jgi:hypothetical protein|nr:hypothetical protein [Bacteriovoracaceae bacterium]